MSHMFHRFLLFVLVSLLSISASAAGLRVGVSADYPPIIYKQDGQFHGIEADNARAVGSLLGKEMILVEMPFTKLIPALVAGEIDVIMSGLSVTEQRSAQVQFIDPYMEMGQMAIMHKEKIGRFSQPWSIYSEGVRIGVEPGTTGAEFAEAELPDAQISFFKDSAAAFAGLRQSQIDLYIHDAPTSWQLATADNNSDLISMYQPLTKEVLAWAVRKDDPGMAGQLNSALNTMRVNGTLRYILNRWIPVTVEVR